MNLKPMADVIRERRGLYPGDVWLSADQPPDCHFRLKEFLSPTGVAVVRSDLLRALEALRRALCEAAGEEVLVRISSGTRTMADQVRLAQRLGWTDQGGLVARDSRHLPQYGGIAADLYARTRSGRDIPQRVLAAVCTRFFPFVKADYRDGHVHVDMRE